MPSFTTLRVLVTLATTISLLSVEMEARPVQFPSSTPSSVRRSPRVALLSTTPTPPLPAVFMVKSSSPSRDSNDATKRDNLHAHIHEHIHDNGGEHDHYYPDRWTEEEMKHHSDHWAWHHGLEHDGVPPYGDGHDHEHIHEHSHQHKREEETSTASMQTRAFMEERGLVGGLLGALEPLLAPLKVIPGFIDIEKLLFGDGAENGGIVKTLGGLLLHVEPSLSSKAKNLYAFSLLASKHERTQVYLAPVNQSCSDGTSTPASRSNDTMLVQVTVPLINETGSAVLMCASVAKHSPNGLSLKTCATDEERQRGSKKGASQLFTYDRKTGSLSPMSLASNITDKVMATVSAKNLATVPQDGDDAMSAPPQEGDNADASKDGGDDGMATSQTGSNTTSDDSMTGATKSKLFMHFTPVSAMSSDSNNTNTSSTNDTTSPSQEQTMSKRTSTPLSIHFFGKRQEDGADDAATQHDASLDEEPGSSGVGSEDGLISNVNSPMSEDDGQEADDDEPSQIFLAELNVEDDEQKDAVATPPPSPSCMAN